MIIEHATYQDLETILNLQKLAYQSEALRYRDNTLRPLTQTLDMFQKDFKTQIILKASVNKLIVGSVRAHAADGTCFIGRLIVHPDCQSQGIGTTLMHRIEAAFPRVKRFELFTGHKSSGPLHIYRKLGYTKFKSKTLETHTLIYLEKKVQ
jgi:GNAT superfamily N-acetyltransferase